MEAMVSPVKLASVARKASPAGTERYDWFPDWRDETCVIVASGPTARNVDLREARGRARFIAVNTSYQLCPWADVLYACDFSWWFQHKGVPEFKGLKASIDARCTRLKGIHTVRRKYGDKGADIEFKERGLICYGGNSGFQALNLAVQFGSRKIILVGFDMRIDRGLHWHKAHAKHNPRAAQVERWRKLFDGAAPSLEQAGLCVINCSLVSALENYPKMTIAQALNA